MSFRSYAQVEGSDHSGMARQIGEQRERVRERLASVEHVVAIVSGKGGVGKSFLCAALARVLARDRNLSVGVLDADLHSPTVARMLEATGPVQVAAGGAFPTEGSHGVKVVSTELLLGEGRPLEWSSAVGEEFVWRGSLEMATFREFLADVVWGDMDLLLIDLPPGTDALSNLISLVPDYRGSVAVTIPSWESQASVERAVQFSINKGAPVLGVVENMSAFACPDCGGRHTLLEGTAGRELAERFDIPLLGALPFDPQLREAGANSRSPELEVVVEAFLGVLE